MSAREWLFIVTVCGLLMLRALWRGARRRMRRVVRAGVTALVVGFVAGQLRSGWRAWRTRPARRPAVLQGDDMWRACTLSPWAGDPARCRWCNGQLPADEERFCGVGCADPALDNHVFDRARLARRRMDGWKCTRCGDGRRLQVHHKTAVLGGHKVPGCHHHLDGLTTLCSGRGSCHQADTNRQRASGAFRRTRRAA